MHQNQDLGLAAESNNQSKHPETGSTLIGSDDVLDQSERALRATGDSPEEGPFNRV